MTEKFPLDRLPPSSVEAESAVLGCMMLSPKECIGEAVEKLHAGREVFYDLRHQVLYSTMQAMYADGKHVDLVTIYEQLKSDGKVDDAGGVGYIGSHPHSTSSAAGLDYYLEIIVEKYLVRKLIQVCAGIISKAYDWGNEPKQLLDEAEREILAINRQKSGIIKTSKELVHEAIAEIEKMHESKGQVMGIATGFVDLDKMTTGLQNGDMAVIAARPSVGKTSLGMCIAEHVAVNLALPVGVFSLEMTDVQLMLRMIAGRARVNLRSIRDGFMAERDLPKLTSAAGRLAGAPLYIDPTCGLNVLQLKARARRYHQQYGIKLFVIDYLGLMSSGNRRNANRQEDVSEMSGGIKQLAKELNVPFLVMAQLNRDIEKRGQGERPRLSDLRESGSIEQDSDLVGFLYRPKSHKEDADDDTQDAVPVNLWIGKQRNGPTGDVHLTFLKSYTRFESAAKVGLGDLPDERNNYREAHND